MIKKYMIFFLILCSANQVSAMKKNNRHAQYHPGSSSSASSSRTQAWGTRLWNTLGNAFTTAKETVDGIASDAESAISENVPVCTQIGERIFSTNSKEKQNHVYRLLLGFSSCFVATLMGLREIARPAGNQPLGLLATTVGSVGIWAMGHELHDNAATLNKIFR